MLSRIANFFVMLMLKWLPDPFLFAVLLTFLAFAIGVVLAPEECLGIVAAWAEGLFRILTFAMQMVLILVTGHALASAPLVKTFLTRVSALPKTQGQAAVVVLLGAALGSLLNWGFGLVVGAILSRCVAFSLRKVNFGFLVAAAYAGFMVWESGLSSSIALISATAGSPMNFAEKIGGRVLPLSETLLSPLNIVPVLVTLCVLPLVFLGMQPKGQQVQQIGTGGDEADLEGAGAPDTPARKVEESRLIAIVLGALVVAGLVLKVVGGGSFDINAMILVMFGLGIFLHGTPMAYARAINKGAKTVGPLLIQYPLYGGIQGVLEASGAAKLLSDFFVQLASAKTLPFWSYVASCVLNFFVPSGGGHWIVQGPIVVEAAKSLGASQAATAMGVAFGDQVANMVQPFWALPLLAVAGVSVREMMGYCVVAFFVGFTVFGAALLALPGV